MAVNADLVDLRVLLVPAPGADLIRIAVEAALVAAGGELALTPAAGNLLLVCGQLPDRLAEHADRLWEQMPHPRVRLEVAAVHDAERMLAAAASSLRDVPAQRAAAARGADPGHGLPSQEGHEDMDASGPEEMAGGHEGMDMSGHGGMDMSAHEGHGGMDMSAHQGHGGMDMSAHQGHGGMDMSGHDHMNMSGPGGIPLASGDEDRDGLEMDVLNRTLGPVLPLWDSRILVRVVLAGDTIRSAEVELVAPAEAPPPGSAAVLRLDEAVRFLRIAGGDAVGDRLTRARNAAFDGRTDAALRDARSARRRIGRSPLIRWTLRGLTVRERPLRVLLLDRLDEAILLLRGETPAATAPLLGAEELAALVTGRDLGTARLLIAAVQPDPSSAAPPPAEPAAEDPAAERAHAEPTHAASGHAAAPGGHHHG
ncbi:MAG: hypothetical protein HY996_07365 [Micrococcales bacterium]|nr:hypothetical protein [Micrococcales bacterium]